MKIKNEKKTGRYLHTTQFIADRYVAGNARVRWTLIFWVLRFGAAEKRWTSSAADLRRFFFRSTWLCENSGTAADVAGSGRSAYASNGWKIKNYNIIIEYAKECTYAINRLGYTYEGQNCSNFFRCKYIASPNDSRLGNVGRLIFRKVATTFDVLQKFHRSVRFVVHRTRTYLSQYIYFVCLCVCARSNND